MTQGLLGAAASQAAFQKKLPANMALVIGALSGMAADIDIYISSDSDPTVGWIYHRHFTHSLFFIPIGGALCALPFLLFPSLRSKWKDVLGASTIAYATHGLLDACTSYGTLLLWPFTNARIAWDWIGIVDLFFTPILLIGVVAAAIKRSAAAARVALAAAGLYMITGAVQHARALSVQHEIASLRGHAVDRGRVMPSPGALVLWRSVYEDDGVMHMDGIRTPYFRRSLVAPGTSAPVAHFEDIDFANESAMQAARPAYDVFHWFSGGYVTMIPGEPGAVGDVRYAAEAQELRPLWGIRFDEEGRLERWRGQGGRKGFAARLWQTLLNGDPAYLPLAHVAQAQLEKADTDDPSDPPDAGDEDDS